MIDSSSPRIHVRTQPTLLQSEGSPEPRRSAGRRSFVAFVILALLPVPAGLALHHALAVPGVLERISNDAAGNNGNQSSGVPSSSGDGRFVAFFSDATNLVAGDTNNKRDIFVRDRVLETQTRASVSTAGVAGDGESTFPYISGNGRFVVFESDSSNLVNGDSNGVRDIFIRDLQSETTERVSVGPGGAQANAASARARCSADGRFVVFHSSASNLVVGDNNNQVDVFLHDRQTGVTARVSVATGGAEGDGSSSVPSISDDGNLIVFESQAVNFAANDNNLETDVFLHNRTTATTIRISSTAGGASTNGFSAYPQISGDGKFVSFSTNATNFPDIANDGDEFEDIILYSIAHGTFERISKGLGGAPPDGNCLFPGISGDGRFVTFSSLATNLVDEDNNNREDAFIYDRAFDVTLRVSLAPDGTQIDGFARNVSISADGNFVAFMSDATNLLPMLFSGTTQVYGFDFSNGDPPPPVPFLSLTMTLERSRLGNPGKALGDSIQARGTIELNDLSIDGAMNAVDEGVIIRVGKPEAPYSIQIPPADPRWKSTKKGVLIFRANPTGALSPFPASLLLKMDPVKKTYDVRISKFDFPQAPVDNVMVRIQVGNDTGSVVRAFKPSKNGLVMTFTTKKAK